LGEETEGDKNDQTTSITRSFEKIKPWVALDFKLKSDSFLNFSILNLDEFRLFISTSMTFCKYLESFLIFSFGYKETWGFWYEPVLVSEN
jgi:hypothetical protein